jgi:hypothetical protein
MYETVLERHQRVRRAVREFLDLSACRVFTTWQQILWALAFAAIGAAGAIAAVVLQVERIEPVAVSDVEIQRLQPDYSVYRVRFEWRGREISSCHIVTYGETGKWTVKC